MWKDTPNSLAYPIGIKFNKQILFVMKKFVKETISVIVSELVKILCGFKGCTFVSALWVSDAESLNNKLIPMKAVDEQGNEYGRALKANNPLFGRLTAVFFGINLQFGVDYENSVNNRLKANGLTADFSAEKLPWGEWHRYLDEKGEEQTAFPKVIYHKGNFYIRLYKIATTRIRATYYVDGVKVDYKDIQPYLKEENKESGKQLAAGLEADKQSKPFSPQIGASLKMLALNHKRYYIV